MKKNIFTFIGILLTFVAQVAVAATNQEFDLRGHVIDAKSQSHIPHATIVIEGTTIGTAADKTGHFALKGVPAGKHTIQVMMVGYSTATQTIDVSSNINELRFELTEDIMSLDQVIVSSSRTETTRRHSPTLVSVMSSDMFERVSAPTLADGLTFNTGVRVDNNCQNCGFTQVRINGLEGTYSQILIDSRPIFSALTGVYGLESIPAAMVDRVEVVRGGGSALFGSSAIGGTINIITKIPEYSGAELSSTLTVLEGGSVDSNTTANATYVTDNGKAGFTMFAQSRTRDSYDANNDGFSEIPELTSKTIGLRTFFKTSDYSRLSLSYDATSDYRRGGDKLDEPMELAEVCESASHTINSASVNFDLFSRNRDRKLNIYSSLMNTARDTYYNASGSTDDFTIATGAQFTSNLDRLIFMPSVFIAGFEHTYNHLYDQQYNYSLSSDSSVGDDEFQFTNEELYIDKSAYGTTEQRVNTYSLYAQNEWKNDKVGILIGARADYNDFIERVIVSPRLNFRYNPSESFNFRATYASGFRSPQLFDEDLHIMIVQGEQSKIENADDLKEEKSHSMSVSADMYKTFGGLSTNFLVEGFYTILQDAFTLSEHEQADGYILQTRSNSAGAKVYGASFEARAVVPNVVEFQAGFTVQRSKYDESEERTLGETTTDSSEIDPDNEDLELEFAEAADQFSILRSPNNYGYFSVKVPLSRKLTFNSTATYTGSMLVEHVMGGETVDMNGDAFEYEYTDYINSESFFDMNLSLTYDFTLASSVRMSITGGVQNIFNAYQSNFDTGADRDAGFVYGPMNPRRFTIGAKLTF